MVVLQLNAHEFANSGLDGGQQLIAAACIQAGFQHPVVNDQEGSDSISNGDDETSSEAGAFSLEAEYD